MFGKKNTIYLDHASATPPDPRVLRVFTAAQTLWANPSALYADGVTAKNLLEQSRRTVADIVRAHPDEMIFTSGGSEGNNLAIRGIVNAYLSNVTGQLSNVPNIVTTNIEHASVLETCRDLEKTGRATVTYVPVEPNGVVDPKKIKEAITPETVLVSVMYANNEIGTIQPIHEIAKVIRYFRKSNVTGELSNVSYPYFHTDAIQAINYFPLFVDSLGVDLMTLSASKAYGIRGSGILYVRRNTKISPEITGGEQEYGLRAGTESPALASACAHALKISADMRDAETSRLTILRGLLFTELKKVLPEMIVNGDRELRLPNNVNISIPNISSEMLTLYLGARGVLVSGKSACKSTDESVSHVIAALRPDESPTTGSLRFSLGRATTESDIHSVIVAIKKVLPLIQKK